MIDAHTDPLLTVAEISIWTLQPSSNKSLPVSDRGDPAVSKAEALAALDYLERHATGCSSAIHALRGYLALPHD